MKERLFTVFVKGNNHTWAFDFVQSEEYWQDWEDDGLQVEMKIASIQDGKIEVIDKN